MSSSPAATVARQRRSAAYAHTKETREQAGPLRSIVRGDMWSAFSLSFTTTVQPFDGVEIPRCLFHLFAILR